MKNLCGIDEAGRGPLAGPLVMAGVILYEPIEGLTDSKQLCETKRDSLYEIIVKDAAYHIVTFDSEAIDTKGISACLIAGLKEIMTTLRADDYLFDGNTAFKIPDLRCKIKADLTVPQVSAASILAKVTRDRIMVEMGKRFPLYGFEKHKGYGTKEHLAAIAENGYSPIHRKSFKIKSFRQPKLF
ncbi:ribonuclease HII [Hydrogenimonas sp.]